MERIAQRLLDVLSFFNQERRKRYNYPFRRALRNDNITFICPGCFECLNFISYLVLYSSGQLTSWIIMASRVAAVCFCLAPSFLSDSRRSDEGLDLCSACEAVTGVGSIDGAQIIGAASSRQAATGYWGGSTFKVRLWPFSEKSRFPPKQIVPHQNCQSGTLQYQLRTRKSRKSWRGLVCALGLLSGKKSIRMLKDAWLASKPGGGMSIRLYWPTKRSLTREHENWP